MLSTDDPIATALRLSASEELVAIRTLFGARRSGAPRA